MADAALASAAAAAVTAAGLLRYMRAVRVPKLVCADDAEVLQRLLLDESGGTLLREPYWPHVLHWHWIASCSIAAVKGMPIPRSWRQSEEVLITLTDGGTVALDWWGSVPRSSCRCAKPVALVLPGMANSSLSIYIRHTMSRLACAGFQPVALNYRGVEHLEVTSPRLGCADAWQDLPEVLDVIESTCPGMPIVAVGFSMGGTILTKYLGEYVQASRIVAAVAVSAPLSYPAHMRELHERKVLSFLMAQPLKAWLWQKRGQLAVHWPHLDLQAVMMSKSLLDLAGMFLKFQGYPDIADYFAKNDPEPGLARIACPLLLLGATDDPLMLPIPRDVIRGNRRIILVETPGGGHLGWAGWSSSGPSLLGSTWADSVSSRFLNFYLRKCCTPEAARL